MINSTLEAVNPKLNPRLDLVIERTLEVSPERVWAAWTQPELLKKWFAPAPWSTVDCEIDLRPGGQMRTTMRSPEGQDFPGVGCYLEVVEKERLVFTDALTPGYRPSSAPFFTAVITLEPYGTGTQYRVVAMHADEATRDKHEEMGFEKGWNQCLDQLIEVAKGM
ncbi:MAG: SRPBCC family protein [Pseudopedobacter sp.]|nr:SRPBCC family protein [Deinococcales bacterium]